MDDSGQIDLLTAASFRIGALLVEPPLRRVSSGAAVETLQPRVMQVLVALARANGTIVSRDALVRQCWEGRIVGDDSINRVMSRLRRLSDEHGEGNFRVETLTKAGYRLIGEVGPQVPVGQPPIVSDRANKAAPPWLGRRAIAGGVAIGAVALAAILLRQPLGIDSSRPVVEVEPFTITASGIPPGLVAELRAETADFLANEKFYAVTVPRAAGGPPPDWRIRGTVAPDDNGRRVVVFAELLRRGSDAAVAQLRVERDVKQPMLARSLGLRIGRTAGCVLLDTTNPELTGGFVEAALPALSASCITWHDKTSSTAARIDRFRDNALSLPKSAYFRARLGELYGDLATEGGADAAMLRNQGLAWVAAAETIDPTQPHNFLARARLLPPSDFAGREAMLRKALTGRPSDCACEFGDYSNFLSMVGRNAEARTHASRAREKEPKNIPWLRRAGEAAAVAGDYRTAHFELTQVAGYLPDPSNLDAWRMNLGIWSRDWPLAKAMVARQPDLELRSLQTALIAALETADRNGLDAAGQSLLARSKTDAPNDRAVVTALAMSGKTSDALVAADRLLERQPIQVSVLFEPSFADARRAPAFLTLAQKTGLVGYWRTSGHLPDFCGAKDAPPLCRNLRRVP